MLITRLTVGPMEVNAYIVHQTGRREALVIDPGDEAERILKTLDSLKAEPSGVVLTHAHLDHWGALSAILSRYPVPVLLHPADRDLIDHEVNRSLASMLGWQLTPFTSVELAEGEVELGGYRFQVIHTPGHSPGSVVLRFGDSLLTGDTLFAGGIGRSDLPGGDGRVLMKSLDLLKRLQAGLIVYPGHGEESSIEQEARFNPYW